MTQSTEAGLAPGQNIADRLNAAVAISRAIEARVSHWIEADDVVEIGRLFVLHHDLIEGAAAELAGAAASLPGASAGQGVAVPSGAADEGAAPGVAGGATCSDELRADLGWVLGLIAGHCAAIKMLAIEASNQEGEVAGAMFRGVDVMASAAGSLADRLCVALTGTPQVDHPQDWLQSGPVSAALQQLDALKPVRPVHVRRRSA